MVKPLVLPEAAFIGRNQDFDLYRMPIDQMLCLVPNEEAYNRDRKAMNETFDRMNGPETHDDMPNGYEKQQLIPSNQ